MLFVSRLSHAGTNVCGTIIAPGGYGDAHQGYPRRAELRNPDLSRMYKEVVKLRLQVRQAEAEARSRNAGNVSRTVTGTGQLAATADLRPLSGYAGFALGEREVQPSVGAFSSEWFPP